MTAIDELAVKLYVKRIQNGQITEIPATLPQHVRDAITAETQAKADER